VIENLGSGSPKLETFLGRDRRGCGPDQSSGAHAAIIAAQAGEHGKGSRWWGRDQRSRGVHRRINQGDLGADRGVQGESRNAVAVMTKGSEKVRRGVRWARGGECAEEDFRSPTSPPRWSRRSRRHGRAVRGSKQVTAAVQKIAETVQQISRASNEQRGARNRS